MGQPSAASVATALSDIDLGSPRTLPTLFTSDALSGNTKVNKGNELDAYDVETASQAKQAKQQQQSARQKQKGPDVVFLVHPAYLTDVPAVLYTPSETARWEPSWWVYLLLPFLWIASFYLAHIHPQLTGKSHLVVEDVEYAGVRVQVWIVRHFGRHFRNEWERKFARRNVELAALNAERCGAKVLGLGALNKAEFLNNGGRDLLKVLPSERTMAVTHGNHLTAAAVVETVRQLHAAGMAQGLPIMFTGATSKTGRAVALALHKHHGIPLLCHSASPERRADLESFGIATTTDFEDGASFPMWIIGKYDLRVNAHMPVGAMACVFAVPNPLVGKRPDVRVVEGATLHLDLSRLSKPRAFANLLKAHEIHACHAGAILRGAAIQTLGSTDEVGEIDPDSLDDFMQRANQLGLVVPPLSLTLLESTAAADPVLQVEV